MNLRDPESMYRPVPFWSWNEKLSPEELRWQIREMKKVGLGGFFMHARGGLQTGYLSDEWMDCVKAWTSASPSKRPSPSSCSSPGSEGAPSSGSV